MARAEKTLEKVLRGSSDANISFGDLIKLLDVLGFNQRIRSSQRIFSKAGVEEILNSQPNGAKAKPYQGKQIRHVILKHHLAENFDAQV